MPEARYVTVQFCDDIRQEVGNKYSLVGCYGPSMLLSALPVVLPKLCAFVRIYTPVDRPFAKLSIRVLRGDQLLTELEIPQEILASASAVEHLAGKNVAMVGSGLAISPLPIEEPCTLRIEVDTDEGPLQAETLRIERA
ncbi:MAG TPA: hypothetical protein VFN79_06830 [Steroidobacteraceae bacterium]|nr:hypothetical protein [Steroidobacteraceae bacterium]